MRRTLDTNICSYVLRRHPASMIERFAGLDRTQLWLSAVVAAELRFGAVKLASPRFSAAVEAWLAGFDVRPWPVEATHHYAQMRAALEHAGQPVGAMDMMIAAHALAEDSVVVTNNAREFHRVPGLAVEEWALYRSGPVKS
jgi:tRNA(fMet)-specific endonuclease VapC